MTTEAQEKRLIEALKKVDAQGDVAPAHVHDPMTMVLRQKAILADLMRWDDSRGHYVLTGTGRNRITARNRVPGTVVRFRTQNDFNAQSDFNGQDDKDTASAQRKAD